MSALREGPSVVVAGHNVTDETFWIGEGLSAWRQRNRCQGAGPEIGKVAIFVRQRAIAFPPHADIERQFTADLPIILDKGVFVAQCITMDYAIYAAAYAEQTSVKATERCSRSIAGIGDTACGVAWRAAGAANQEIGKRVDDQETAAQPPERQRPAHVLELETKANGVASFGPGELVGVLKLRRWSERWVQAAANIERAGDIHDRRLRVGPTRSSVAASDIDHWFQSDLLRRIGDAVAAILNDPLERNPSLVDK